MSADGKGGASGRLQCEALARAALGDRLRHAGAGLLWRCPNHTDEYPSLSVNPKKNVWFCGPCGASGNAWQLVAFLAKVSLDDTPTVEKWLADHGLLSKRASGNGNRPGEGLTLARYAEAKRLPVEFLCGLGVEEIQNHGKPALKIIYRLEDGSLAPRQRIRTALRAKEGSYWDNAKGGILPYGLDRLPEVRERGYIVLVEGESDAQTLWFHGEPALGIPGAVTSNNEWAAYLDGVPKVYAAIEPGDGGRAFQAKLLQSPLRERLWFVTLPGVKDVSEFHCQLPETFKEQWKQALALAVRASDFKSPAKRSRANWEQNPWAAAETMETFLSGEEIGLKFLDAEKRIVARECVTEIFSPRGLGKSLFALWLALVCALRGLRVLLLDRDNSRFVVKARLRNFGAEPETPNLKIITREKCPPMTNALAWTTFPCADYDVVILDSLDAASEGVGEKDSAKPSKAFAPLLDITRRENGRRVLVLGNTVRTGQHSRCSGVIEDRADIVYEVRDATNFQPSGGPKHWVEELPPADAGSWAARSSRRKRSEKYRLAFTPSKFKVEQEPEPFIVEINTAVEPWTIRDVTDEVDQQGKEAMVQRAAEKEKRIADAATALVQEIGRRATAGEPPTRLNAFRISASVELRAYL